MTRDELIALAEKSGAEVGRYEGEVVWVKLHQPSIESFSAALSSATPAGGGLPAPRELPEQQGSTYFRALGWNECLDEVKRRAASPVPLSDTGGQEVREAEGIILALLRDTIDYGSPQSVSKGWATDFLRKLTGRAASPPPQSAPQDASKSASSLRDCAYTSPRRAVCQKCGQVHTGVIHGGIEQESIFYKAPTQEAPHASQSAPGEAERPSNWHRHHVAVSKAALQMVRNALHTDAQSGRIVRAEMLAELDLATFDIPATTHSAPVADSIAQAAAWKRKAEFDQIDADARAIEAALKAGGKA